MNIAQSCYKIPINADEDLTKKNKEIQIARFQDKIKFSKYDIYIMPIERQNSHICQSQYMYVLIFSKCYVTPTPYVTVCPSVTQCANIGIEFHSKPVVSIRYIK